MRLGKSVHLMPQNGFTYVIVLCALVLFGLGLAAFGKSWSMASQRLKEDELIQIGNEMVWAIGDYYQHPPGNAKTFPKSLAELVEDKRFVGTHRHLRRIYRDPITLAATWGVISSPQGGIMGVYSLNETEALQKNGFLLANGSLVKGTRYIDWKFVYLDKK